MRAKNLQFFTRTAPTYSRNSFCLHQCVYGVAIAVLQIVRRSPIVKDSCCETLPAPLIKSAAFSPIIMVGVLVFTVVRIGIIDASTTRNPSTPYNRIEP